MHDWTLTLTSANRQGLVAAVSNLLAKAQGEITEAAQFNDAHTGQFFMRVALRQAPEIDALRDGLGHEAVQHGMQWSLRRTEMPRKALILVSRDAHCLGDLLYRARIGELNMQCVGVVSNHPRESLAVMLDEHIPFHHLPVAPGQRERQEAQIRQVVTDSGAEMVVLARYMQILSNDLTHDLEGRCINIHHSFLPGFKGARPYHQAYARGVKMIGATAHYVTADLDEGPIIAQDVEYISHADTPEDMVCKGRDIERRVLARAVTWHIQDRVLINGHKTVIFHK